MNKLSLPENILSKFRFKWRKFFTSANTRIRFYLLRRIPMGLKLNIIVLIVTIVVTLSTTALMCFCVVTDYWEIVAYPLSNIEKILNISDASERPTLSDKKDNANSVSVESLYDEKVIVIKEEKEMKQIMIQMHAGLWSICYDVSELEWEQIVQNFSNHIKSIRCYEITQKGFAININKLHDEEKDIPSNPRQLRMRNLCVSCSLVCIILLSSAFIVFLVGFAQKQVPPIVIVSVLYILAAFFGSLALTIIRLRRYQCNTSTQHQNNIVKTSFTSTTSLGGGNDAFDSQGDCLSGIGGLQIDKNISEEFHSAITFHSSWSFYLGWLGVAGCLCSSICVFTLSKLMRNGPYFAT